MKKIYEKTPFQNALCEEFSDFVEEVNKEGGERVDYTRSVFVNAVGNDGDVGVIEALKSVAASKDPEIMRNAVKSLFDLEVTISIKGNMVSVLKEIDLLVKDDVYFNAIVTLAEASALENQPTFKVEALTLKSKPSPILVEDKAGAGAKVSDGAN